MKRILCAGESILLTHRSCGFMRTEMGEREQRLLSREHISHPRCLTRSTRRREAACRIEWSERSSLGPRDLGEELDDTTAVIERLAKASLRVRPASKSVSAESCQPRPGQTRAAHPGPYTGTPLHVAKPMPCPDIGRDNNSPLVWGCE